MAKPDTAAVAKMLHELAQRMALEGGNPYRARAYDRAAENLALSPLPLARLIREDRLQEIPGIGEALAAVITEMHQEGHYSRLDTMRAQTPEGVLEMLRIPGLKPDRVRKLHTELGIDSLAELEKAAQSGRLASRKGYGPAFQDRVLQGIAMSRRGSGRHLHRAAVALDYAQREIARLHPDWTMLTPAGEFRRGCELVGGLSLVAVDPKGRRDAIASSDQLTIHVTDPQHYGITLLLATGSEAHIKALRALARKKGHVLDAEGLRKRNRVIAQENEEDIYRGLGLPFIPPELRESGEEVGLALAGKLSELVTQDDLRGVLHVHTDQSDGTEPLAVMAEATRKRGYAYLGLTDHSQTAHYAGGLKPDRVLRQHAAIDKLNKRYGAKFHVYKGIESDILPDGSLDYAEDILARFDLVVASVHSKFRMGRKEQTDRIIKAIENPHTTVLGHLTGRLLLRRPGYEVDMDRILRACAKHGVAIEINANPWRLDMDWRWCARGLELGCLFSIDPDAHATEEIDNVRWGVLMARKGGVPKERVLNALPLEEFGAHLKARKSRASGQSAGRKRTRPSRPQPPASSDPAMRLSAIPGSSHGRPPSRNVP